MDGTDGASARAHPRRGARWLSDGLVLSFACVDAVYLRMSVRLFVVSIVCRIPLESRAAHFMTMIDQSCRQRYCARATRKWRGPPRSTAPRQPLLRLQTMHRLYLVQQVYPGQVMWRQRWRKWLPLFQPIRSYPANATKTDDFLFLLHSTKEAFNEIFV